MEKCFAVDRIQKAFWKMSQRPLFWSVPEDNLCFKGHFALALHPATLSVQESGHATPKRERAKRRGTATWQGRGVKWDQAKVGRAENNLHWSKIADLQYTSQTFSCMSGLVVLSISRECVIAFSRERRWFNLGDDKLSATAAPATETCVHENSLNFKLKKKKQSKVNFFMSRQDKRAAFHFWIGAKRIPSPIRGFTSQTRCVAWIN